MGFNRVPAGAFTKQIVSLSDIQVKEAGYIFIYLSYEDLSNNFVYFDDFKVTHTKNNIVQYNEYYPFGMQTTNSWTRENTTGNNFLANGGTELNNTSQLYDLDYRNYDPILGRMNQVDPMASKYASYTPYNFSFNDPITFNDPTGADPLYDETTRATFGEHMVGGYFKPHVMDNGVFGRPGEGPITPGSGGNWADGFRSYASNWGLMYSNTFTNFYKDMLSSNQGTWQIANGIANNRYVPIEKTTINFVSINKSELTSTFNRFTEVVGFKSVGNQGSVSELFEITGITTIWENIPDESQISFYKVQYQISKLVSDDNSATVYMARGQMLVRPGGNRFVNEDGVSFWPTYPYYYGKSRLKSTDNNGLVIQYDIRDGKYLYKSFSYEKLEFILTSTNVQAIQKAVLPEDERNNTTIDKMIRLNSQFGSPVLEKIVPTRKIKK